MVVSFFSVRNFEVSVTLERVFHGTFQTQQDLEKAHISNSNREKMAARNGITSESLNLVDTSIMEL